MTVEEQTPNRGLPLVHSTNQLSVDVERLRQMAQMLDVDVQTLTNALSGKADASHNHAITDIVGLQQKITDLENATPPENISDLDDVDAAGTPNGFVLFRQAGSWIGKKLGIGDVDQLTQGLNGKLAKENGTYIGNLSFDNATVGFRKGNDHEAIVKARKLFLEADADYSEILHEKSEHVLGLSQSSKDSRPIPGENCNLAVYPGFYSMPGDNTLNGPAGLGKYGTMVVTRRGDNYIIIQEVTCEGQQWARVSSDDGVNWTSWVQYSPIETGLWTPEVRAVAGTDPTIHWTRRGGRWSKHGKQVHLDIELLFGVQNRGSGGRLFIAGAPFAPDTTVTGYYPGDIAYASNSDNNNNNPSSVLMSAGNLIYMYQHSNADVRSRKTGFMASQLTETAGGTANYHWVMSVTYRCT